MENEAGYAVIDTEGNGLFDYSKPADAEGQPRLAALALIRVAPDMTIESRTKMWVKPDGWSMPQGMVNDPKTGKLVKSAGMVNGLTDEFLAANGRPVVDVLADFQGAIKEGRVAVAHNAQHDMKQLRGELRRAGLPDLFEQTPNVCTMRALTNVCKIPPVGRRGGYKFPALSEAMVFFGLDPLGDHTPDRDAFDCYRLLCEMVKRGIEFEGRVHYAKATPPEKLGDALERSVDQVKATGGVTESGDW